MELHVTAPETSATKSLPVSRGLRSVVVEYKKDARAVREHVATLSYGPSQSIVTGPLAS